MPRDVNRKRRINDLIQNALAEIIQRDAKDLHVSSWTTVTGVEVAHDLSHAKVFISVLEEDKAKEVVTALNNAAKYLRYTLANTVVLRVTPELKFSYDDSTVRGNRISSLLNNALKDDKSKK